jgi:hypothetical protein
MPLPGFLVSVVQLAAVGVSLEALRQGTQTLVDPQKVSKSLTLSLQHWATSKSELRSWLMQLWAADDVSFPTEDAISLSLTRIKQEYQKLNKGKGCVSKEFLAQPYVLPLVHLALDKVSEEVRRRKSAEVDAEAAKDQASRAARETTQLEAQVNGFRVRLHNAVTEKDLLNNTIHDLLVQLTRVNKQKDYFRFEGVRANRRLDQYRSKTEKYRAEGKKFRARLKRCEATIERQVREIRLISARLAQARQRVRELEAQVLERDAMVDHFHEQFQEDGSRIIPAKVGQTYSPQVRLLCMRLIDNKVSLENIPQERLKQLNLQTLETRRKRQDFVEMYKILKGKSTISRNVFAFPSDRIRRTSHSLALKKHRFHLECRGNAFANRLINEWNSLPEDIINAKSISEFKKKLDKFL